AVERRSDRCEATKRNRDQGRHRRQSDELASPELPGPPSPSLPSEPVQLDWQSQEGPQAISSRPEPSSLDHALHDCAPHWSEEPSQLPDSVHCSSQGPSLQCTVT